ncbi:MAG TPA: hypothetical protein DCL77_04810, partial [Prolixibacteraceae bacterium]|nr:hypothetical protein [Prolixibacteraceae bacterium]
MKRQYLNTICFLFLIVSFCCNGQYSQSSSEQKTLIDIQKSHIDDNVANQAQFDSLMKRDLEKYFSATFGPVSVKWEFLRNGATQSGVAYPKYYLWTKIYNGDKLLNEGAVRVAAIEKTGFGITD